MAGLNKTPLYEEHVRLSAKIVEFAGWLMPVYYSNVIGEHINVRQKAGIFDICHMGEFIIEGKDSSSFIQKLITNDLDILEDGKAFYSCMCLENGGIIDDLFVYRFNKNRFMLVVNAININKDFGWLMKHKDFFEDASIINKTEEMAKLDLQGPNSEGILQKLTDFELGKLKRFHFAEGNVGKSPAIISRTGYTAEDGFELYFDSRKAVDLWRKLLDAGKEFDLKPIGLGARDTLRIEAGYSLYGYELTEGITPFEADIAFVAKLDKGNFIGSEALSSQKNNLKRKIFAFEMIDRGIPRQGYDIFGDGEKIGFVTSGTFSPTFKKPIGMAMMNLNGVNAGDEISIKIRDNFYLAKIVNKPVYNFHGKV